jgi:predicted amidohydrolase YtcJ
MPADLLVKNARVWVRRGLEATSFAVKDGRIVALNDANLEATRTLDLGGKRVFPGWNDAHVHVWKVGHLRTTMLDLREAATLEEVYRLVRERAGSLEPGQWLLGRGWNEAKLGGSPDKAALDLSAPRNPVVLTRTCAHIHAANSSALQLAGVTLETSAPPGGELDFERGMLYETAHGLVTRAMPPFTVDDYKRFVRAGLEWLGAHGITSCTDPAVDPVLLEAYRALEAEGALPVRVNVLFIRRPDGGTETYPLPEQFNSPFLRVDSVKFFADGGLSGATAAISQPFKNVDPPSLGVLRFDTEELFELALEAHRAGFRIGTHAIGDRALDQILEVYERLSHVPPAVGATSRSPLPLPHRIEHFGLANSSHRAKARDLGVIVVPQPIFLHELGGNFERYVPDAYAPDCYNLRAMLDAGLTTAFSSDAPVVREVNPLVGIHAAVHEPFRPGNAVTLEEAIEAFTLSGAIAQGDEGNRGTLEVGRWADFVVYDNADAPVQEWKLKGVFVRGNSGTIAS